MTEEEWGKDLSVTLKRRLRRLRVAALKDGVILPYDPVSNPAPVDKNAPKLTNTGKRNLRRLKKIAAQNGLLPDASSNAAISMANLKNALSKVQDLKGEMPKSKKIKKKRRKKKDGDKNSSGLSTEDSKGNVSEEINLEKVSKKRKKEKPGHKRFDESDPEEESLMDDEPKHISKKKKSLVVNTDSVKVESEENSSADDEVVETSKQLADGETKPVKTKDKSGNIIDKSKPDKSKLPAKKRRFVLFIGNLSYSTTEEDIREHFSKVGPIVSVRMAREMDDDTKTKCRGFCHLDLENEETYLKALSLNHTFLAKRRINVEYSTGQTKELKAEQKKKSFKMKALYKSGRGFEVMNPVGGESKAAKRSKARTGIQKEGNKFWV